MSQDDFIAEAVRLAEESVVNGWGGPFGAVIVRDGEIIARGRNLVLLTGDITAHAEIQAIRKACSVVNPFAPAIAEDEQDKYHLRLDDVASDSGPRRARMLSGMEIYSSGAPCPMCLSAIYWARLDAVYFSFSLDDARDIGFDDAFQYEDFARPYGERRIKFQQLRPDLGARACQVWRDKKDRHYY